MAPILYQGFLAILPRHVGTSDLWIDGETQCLQLILLFNSRSPQGKRGVGRLVLAATKLDDQLLLGLGGFKLQYSLYAKG